MLEPRRVKVQGDLFHGRVPEGAVYAGRAAPGLRRSPFNNPHRVGKPCGACAGAVHTLDEALTLYSAHLDANPELVERARQELAGHDLACWCGLSGRCHVDELLRRANDATRHFSSAHQMPQTSREEATT